MNIKYEKFTGLVELLEKRKPLDRMFSGSRKKRAHYASGGIGCTRQNVYEFIGTPELSTDLSGRMTFRLGDAGQEAIEEEFIACKIQEAREQSIELQDPRLKYPFSMRIDTILKLPPDLDPEEKLRPMEIKTSGASQFYDIDYKAWNGMPDKTYPGSVSVPKEYHLQQLNLYLKAMNLDWGSLVVINKDNSDYVIYKVWYSEEMYESMVAHCLKVEEAFETFKVKGLLPPRIIESLPLSVYTRGSSENPPGTPNLKKSAFPCIYRNKDSGRYGLCKFFDTCHGETLKNLGLSITDFVSKTKKDVDPEYEATKTTGTDEAKSD